MDELIDIFDEKGNHIGTELKSVAHKLGHWHKSIHAYLINDKGEIVLQQRSPDKNLYPNYWDVSFAGHVGAGENTLSSAQRECKEELSINLNANDLEYLFTVPERLQWGDVDSREFVDVFLCRKNFDKESIKLQEEEVAGFVVMSISKFIDEIKTIELSHICAENSGGFNLNNVNLKFEKGKLTVVTGESGCGKSTLIKILCGLCERTSGDIIINSNNKIFSSYLAVGKMSVSMQDAYIFNRDAKLNILYPDGNISEEDYAPVVEDLSLGGVMKRKYDEESEHNLENMLSGGEKKRIGISRALIKKADVYIFDEPTNDLDNNNANKVINSIIKLKDNAIVIVVTHDDRVKAIADQIVYFKERGVIENTKLDENVETSK